MRERIQPSDYFEAAGEVNGNTLTIRFADGTSFSRTLTEEEMKVLDIVNKPRYSIAKPKGEGK